MYKHFGSQFPSLLQSYHATQKLHSRYFPKRVENYVHTKICTRMFIAALFIIIKLEAIKMPFSRLKDK